MEFNELQTFLQIVRESSLGKAAASLKTSQPTLSLRLKGLENRVGTPLFIRSHAGMRLTPAGERLVPFAERIVQLANEGLESVQEEFVRE